MWYTERKVTYVFSNWRSLHVLPLCAFCSARRGANAVAHGRCVPAVPAGQGRERAVSSVKGREGSRFLVPFVWRWNNSNGNWLPCTSIWKQRRCILGPHRTHWRVRHFVGKMVWEHNGGPNCFIPLFFLRALISMESTGEADMNWPGHSLQKHSISDAPWAKSDTCCLCCLLRDSWVHPPPLKKATE